MKKLLTFNHGITAVNAQIEREVACVEHARVAVRAAAVAVCADGTARPSRSEHAADMRWR